MNARASPTPSKLLIAKNVKTLREHYKLTQTQLAKIAGVSQATISNMENPAKAGESYSPSMDNVDTVASAFALPGAVLAMDFPLDLLLDFQKISSVVTVYANADRKERQAIEIVADIASHKHNALLSRE